MRDATTVGMEAAARRSRAARRRAGFARRPSTRTAPRLVTRSVALGVLLAALLAVGGCASGAAARGDGGGADSNGTDETVFALAVAAEAAYRDGRWIDAARDYGRLAERVPGDAHAWFRLGNVRARQGDWGRAIDAYERSLAADPARARPWFNLSTAYLLRARDAMARARERLRADDPAREMIGRRLLALEALLHERIEDEGEPAALR